MVGSPNVIFLIKCKIKEFEGSKYLVGSGGPATSFKSPVVVTSGELTAGPKGKTEIEPNKEKRYSRYSVRSKKIRFITQWMSGLCVSNYIIPKMTGAGEILVTYNIRSFACSLKIKGNVISNLRSYILPFTIPMTSRKYFSSAYYKRPFHFKNI